MAVPGVSAGCEFTSLFSDALPTWLGGTGGALSPCEVQQGITNEASGIAVAGAGDISLDQATTIATTDQTAINNLNKNNPIDPGCSTFADLSNQTFGTAAWFTCLQEVLAHYAIWLVGIVVVILVVLAWAYGGFK